MAKLVEDARVTTFGVDTAVKHDTYLNEYQDQVRGMVKSLQVDLSGHFIPDTNAGATAWAPYFHPAGAIFKDWCWQTGAAPNGEYMICPVPLRVGQKITQIDALYRDSSRNGGHIILYRKQWIAVGNAANLIQHTSVQDIGGANPWNKGGTNFQHIQLTGLSIIIAEGYTYYVSVAASTTGAGILDEFNGLAITAQFGN
jgi:hypothetical protein